MAKSSKEEVFSELKRKILTLELAPGSDLDEVSLAAHFGLSRTPLREVLQRLAGRGYAQIASNRGAKVASMDIETMRTLFRTAPLIYASIARLAADNRSEAQIETLKSDQSAFLHAVSEVDPNAAALANHQFHERVGAMARNPYLSACLDRLLIDHTRLGRVFYQPRSQEDASLIQKAGSQHDQMIAAFEAQDADLAVALTLQHWDLSRDRVERFVHPDPLPFDAKDLADAI